MDRTELAIEIAVAIAAFPFIYLAIIYGMPLLGYP